MPLSCEGPKRRRPAPSTQAIVPPPLLISIRSMSGARTTCRSTDKVLNDLQLTLLDQAGLSCRPAHIKGDRVIDADALRDVGTDNGACCGT